MVEELVSMGAAELPAAAPEKAIKSTSECAHTDSNNTVRRNTKQT